MTNYDVIKKLIGPINPAGDASIDGQRLENLKATCLLVETLLMDIDDLIFKYKTDHQESVKKCVQYASGFMSTTVKDLVSG